MKSRTPRVIAVLALTVGTMALSSSSALASTPLTVNGGWTEFSWVATGPAPDAPFTFTSNKTTMLKITDVEAPGDQFFLMDGNKKLGNTNHVKRDNSVFITGDQRAYNSKQFSHGTWTLLPGTHSISVDVLDNSFPTGSFAIRVDTLKTGK